MVSKRGTLSYYIQKIKEMNQNMKQVVNSIPNYIVEMFIKLSIKDAEKFLKERGYDEKDQKDLAFIIYKAYIAGMFIEKVRAQEKESKIVSKEDNIIHIKAE